MMLNSRRRGLRTALVVGVVVAVLAGNGSVAVAVVDPPPSVVELESLRDQLAAAAPSGSVTYVNPAGNAIIMRIPGLPTEAVTNLINGRTKLVRLQTGADPVRTLSMLYGGVRMTTTNEEIPCSTGFIATGGGWRWMITAGHCVAGTAWDTAYWFTAGGYGHGGLIGVGTILDPSFPGDDFGVVQISRISPYDTGPYVLMNGSPLRMTQVSLVGPPPAAFLPGTQVYKTGGTTGTTVGNVTAVNVTVTYQHPNVVVGGLTEITACAEEGDSGSPVFSDAGHAFGVISGGTGCNFVTATPRTYFQPLWEPLQAYGLTFLL